VENTQRAHKFAKVDDVVLLQVEECKHLRPHQPIEASSMEII
jgi:hypothetical protein